MEAVNNSERNKTSTIKDLVLALTFYYMFKMNTSLYIYSNKILTFIIVWDK